MLERYRQVAALHAANIDQGFLATLGIPFLSLMYQAIDEAPGSVLIVDEREGRVTGFVTGGIGMRPVYRRMLRQPLRLALSLLPSLIRLRRLKRIVDILRYSGGASQPSALPAAELLSIAVDPAWRGKGIAESLYRRLVAHFDGDGVRAFRIVVGDGLLPAHRFYLRMGAKPAGKIEVHAGQASVVYVQQSGRTS